MNQARPRTDFVDVWKSDDPFSPLLCRANPTKKRVLTSGRSVSKVSQAAKRTEYDFAISETLTKRTRSYLPLESWRVQFSDDTRASG